MNLTQLRYFQTVCACGNLTQAAEALHVSQPSLSSAIRALEKEFGVGLFVRQYRGMELTAEGERLLKMSRALTENADKLVSIMQDLGAKRHSIRLGVPPILGGWLLPSLYANFLSDHPELRLEVTENRRAVVEQELEHELLDLAFVIHTQPVPNGFESVPVTILESGAIVSRTHPLAEREAVQAKDLRNEKLVMMPELFFQSELLQERFVRAGQKPHILCRTSQLYTMLQLVRKQQAVGFLYKELVSHDANLRFLPFQEPMKISLSLIWRRQQYRSEGMRELIRFYRELSRQSE
ncbi:MAG: LysR family transcriptional regulator [Acidaminococcus sp.]|jgi:DNA-binding transcriptional LysR family regulator|nr:LysR family transcriptional regulator [Acidaminococcus sp.]MCI2115456.1 LysR family transcriptional regulator [Acidaminococcus sp.]MCI2117579.1 LysR family transcriptional regulator [Acidaminococcus sp.]